MSSRSQTFRQHAGDCNPTLCYVEAPPPSADLDGAGWDRRLTFYP
jgi:hypothetical protein